jgi:hypothetical protein
MKLLWVKKWWDWIMGSCNWKRGPDCGLTGFWCCVRNTLVVERPLPVHEHMSAVNYIRFSVQGLQDVTRPWVQIWGIGGTANWLSLLISWLISEAHGKAARLQRPSLWRGNVDGGDDPIHQKNDVGCRKIDMNSGSIDCKSIYFTFCTHIQVWNGHCGFYLGPVHSHTDQSSGFKYWKLLDFPLKK